MRLNISISLYIIILYIASLVVDVKNKKRLQLHQFSKTLQASFFRSKLSNFFILLINN